MVTTNPETLEPRLSRLEGAYEHVATKEDVANVRTEIANVRTEIAELRGHDIFDVRTEIAGFKAYAATVGNSMDQMGRSQS